MIELKTTEFKPEYAGKLNFYLSAVDKYIKDKNDNPSFGILLCKDKKKVTAELALKDINLLWCVSYFLSDEKVIDREFNAYNKIDDNYPKYVLSMDKFDFSQNGIIHKNIIDFLLEK